MDGPGVSSDGDGLLAEYGEGRDGPSGRRRARQIGELIVRTLRRDDVGAAVHHDGPVVTVTFTHSAHTYVIGLARPAESDPPADENAVRETQAIAPGASVIVLSMSGFAGPRVSDAANADSGKTILWDRTHLEAVLCGLVPLTDLLDASVNAAYFRRSSYEPLARLLEEAPEDDTPAPEMGTPDQLPPPWPVTEPRAGGSGTSQIEAHLALTGEGAWSRPSGIASLGPGRLAIVTPVGLIDLDAARGSTSWLTRLPGCVNEPLVLPDGSLLAVCGRGVARITESGIEAVAGEFDGSPRLLAGPGGEPWVLSGQGSGLPGEGTFALTRLGERPGDQHRYGIECAGNVRAAAWLGGLRFFLAGPGRSAVIDLARSTRVADADWIESRWASPDHLTVADPGSVVTATVESDVLGPGARVTLFRTDLRARATELVGELALNGADGLCTDADGTGYLLGDVSGRPGSSGGTGSRSTADAGPWPVLVRLPGLRPARTRSQVPAQMVVPDASLFSRTRWDAVRMSARGQEKDYELDTRPIDRGGQAEVFGARHRQTGLRVAFKRLRRRAPHTVARMRREIEAAQALGSDPHVMPVLDYGPRYDWFVMPFAEESAATAQPSLRDTAELRALVTAMCEGLRHAHEIGWLHRDIKPANLLRLGGTWTVADWGLVRRPLGTTTEPGRTRLGAAFGTIGFGAPELSADPHRVGPQADIFGIGQIIGWAVTGQMPQANTPLIPADGPWRQVVRAATQLDPGRRPPTVDALLQLVAEELDYKRPDISKIAWELSEAARSGDSEAAADLFALAARYPDDLRLYTETLPAMTREPVIAAVNAARHDTLEILGAMAERARSYAVAGSGSGSGAGSGSGSGGDRSERITTWLHWIQARAGEVRDLELLEEATRAVLAWDERWDREGPRRQIAGWLPLLQGDAAAAVARALRETPRSARHFTGVLDDGHTDERIQRAVRAALNLAPAAGFVAGGPTQVDSGLSTFSPTQVDAGPEPYELPPEDGAFVGRADELAELSRLLNTGRLVTVTGPAGAGKTRLALHGAARAASRFSDGACLIELSGTRDPAQFPAAIGAELGVGDMAPQEVISYLLRQDLLIVLDGCEQLLGPCADFVSCVMRDTAGVTVIATSEQPLAVTGERCLPVEPLPAPAPELASRPAADPAEASQAGPVPGQRENPCSADVDTLYAQCTPTEQALWQRLSVFSGVFDADAAGYVCADPALDSGGGVMGGLIGLAAKSVVTVHESPRGPRYRLPEGCRELGAEKLAASGQEQLVRARHFKCYQAMSHRFAAHFLGRDGAALLRQLRASYPDIRAALEYASGDGVAGPVQGSDAASLAVALSDFWRADAQLDEGRYWLGRTVESCPAPTRELAQALIVRGHLAATAGEALRGITDIREGIRIAAALDDQPVVAIGNLHLTQALTFAEYYEDAAAAGTEAYHLLRHLGDDPGSLRLQAELASLETLAGSAPQAVRRCEKSLLNESAAGWVRGYLHAAMALAQFHQPGLETECEASTCEALRVYQEFGDRTGMAYALEMLGWLAARAGRHMRTAWLLGAADTLWGATGSRLSNVPAMEEQHTIAETSARLALSQHRFADVRAMGSDSPLNEVIAFAIGDISLKVS